MLDKELANKAYGGVVDGIEASEDCSLVYLSPIPGGEPSTNFNIVIGAILTEDTLVGRQVDVSHRLVRKFGHKVVQQSLEASDLRLDVEMSSRSFIRLRVD